jgi:hypothetical protein
MAEVFDNLRAKPRQSPIYMVWHKTEESRLTRECSHVSFVSFGHFVITHIAPYILHTAQQGIPQTSESVAK